MKTKMQTIRDTINNTWGPQYYACIIRDRIHVYSCGINVAEADENFKVTATGKLAGQALEALILKTK